MTIAEDTSTPAAVSTTTTGPVTVTTAAFTPPSGSLLVAMGSAGWGSATTAVPTISDSTGGTWTTGKSVQGTVSPGDGGSCVIAYRYLSSAPGSMTVSCHTDSSNKGGTFLKVAVLTGCSSSQTGATASINVTTASTTWCSIPITTTTAGSRVYGTVDETQGNSTLTAGTGTAFVTQGGGTNPVNDNTNFVDYAAIKASADTGTPGATTLNLTSSVSLFGCAVALEVLPGSSTVNISALDTVSGDDETTVRPNNVADTGSGADTAHPGPNGADTGSGVEAASLTASVAANESATGIDTAGTSVTLPLATDTATASDGAVSAVNVMDGDTAVGADSAVAIVAVLVPATDTGSGSESAALANVSDEPVTSVEAFTMNAHVGDSDTAVGDDEAVLFTVFAGRPKIRVAHVNTESRTFRVPKAKGAASG